MSAIRHKCNYLIERDSFSGVVNGDCFEQRNGKEKPYLAVTHDKSKLILANCSKVQRRHIASSVLLLSFVSACWIGIHWCSFFERSANCILSIRFIYIIAKV